jgi:RHH-type proline utilization regulon transcriptional repressor/proline dehydrogenase/delta 1-pyrroline-5-carboxylate dehydrogenase
VNAWPEIPQIDRGAFSELPRVNVSIKLSALDSQFDELDPAGTTRRVAARLRPLLRAARAERAFVNVDMESYRTKSLTLAIFKSVLLEAEFRRTSDVGIVIQCYLRDAEQDLRGLLAWAKQRGAPVWVRLVKGAYWDYETVHAQSTGWPVPVFQQKWQSDANFERLTRLLIAHHDVLRPALGSHNVRSLAHGIAVARHLGLPAAAIELQMPRSRRWWTWAIGCACICPSAN